MNYRITTRTPTSPISLDDAKEHLQLWGDDSYDQYVMALLGAANEAVASMIGEPLEAYTIEQWYPSFDSLQLQFKAVASNGISSLTYYDTSNASQTVASTDYFLDTNLAQPEVKFLTSFTRPALTRARENPVIVTYTAQFTQYGPDLQHALKMLISDMFYSRESTVDKITTSAYVTAERLLQRYRKRVW